MRRLAVPFAACALFLLAAGSAAAQSGEFTLVIKDHTFQPAELTVPAGQKFVLVVDNQDPSIEEFESKPLKVEKIIGANKQARFNLGPLNPGRYNFFGEFHEKTAQGMLVVQ